MKILSLRRGRALTPGRGGEWSRGRTLFAGSLHFFPLPLALLATSPEERMFEDPLPLASLATSPGERMFEGEAAFLVGSPRLSNRYLLASLRTFINRENQLDAAAAFGTVDRGGTIIANRFQKVAE